MNLEIKKSRIINRGFFHKMPSGTNAYKAKKIASKEITCCFDINYINKESKVLRYCKNANKAIFLGSLAIKL